MNARQLRRLERRQAYAARVAANQANAQLSTGPRTEAGKLASSRNNFRHGFTGSFRVLPSEDQSAFDRLAESLLEEHKPQTPTETILIQDIARHHWLVQRALALQNDCFQAPELNERQLALFLRYQTTHQRAFHRALTNLLNLCKRRTSQQSGFESQNQKSAAASTGQTRPEVASLPAKPLQTASPAPTPRTSLLASYRSNPKSPQSPASILTQRPHGIDASRAAGGKVAG